jgi:hypothetical protein
VELALNSEIKKTNSLKTPKATNLKNVSGIVLLSLFMNDPKDIF